MILLVAALFSIVAGVVGHSTAAPMSSSAQIVDAVTVNLAPRDRAVTLGDEFDLVVEVTNNGPRPTPPLVVHIDITDPSQRASVDPEDWTATLSKPVGVLAAGEVRTVDWRLQPISGGTYAAYAVALAAGVDNIASSNVTSIEVVDRRSLNPNSILPVSIGLPLLVGGLLLAQIRLASRRPGPRTA